MMNKLEYLVDTRGDNHKPASWNERPRDLANLCRWMTKAIEREVNWQIVNLNRSERDILDAPVLYISGKEALNFTPEEELKLKRYIEAGGMVFGNADCASAAFTASFKRIAPSFSAASSAPCRTIMPSTSTSNTTGPTGSIVRRCSA